MTLWDLPNNIARTATTTVIILRGPLALHYMAPRTTCVLQCYFKSEPWWSTFEKYIISVNSPEVQNSQGPVSMEATIVSDAGDQVRCGIQNETFGLEKNVIGEDRSLLNTFWQSRLEKEQANCCGNFTFGGTLHPSFRLPWIFPMFQFTVSIIILTWAYWMWNSEIYGGNQIGIWVIGVVGNLLLTSLTTLDN